MLLAAGGCAEHALRLDDARARRLAALGELPLRLAACAPRVDGPATEGSSGVSGFTLTFGMGDNVNVTDSPLY